MIEKTVKNAAIKYYKKKGYDIHEEYPVIYQGPIIDVVAFKNDQADFLIECKGSVGLTDIVRGIGQCYQYQHLRNKNDKLKKGKVVFLIPQDSLVSLTKLALPDEIDIFYLDKKGGELTLEDAKKELKNLEEEKEIMVQGVFFNEGINSIDRLLEILEVIKEEEFEKSEEELETHYITERIQNGVLKDDGTKFNEKHIRVNFLLTLYQYGFIDFENRLTNLSKRILALKHEQNMWGMKKTIYEIFKKPIEIIWRAIFKHCLDKNLNPCDDQVISNKDIVEKIKEVYIEEGFDESNFLGIRFLNNHQRISNYIGLMDDLGIIKRVTIRKIALIKPYDPWPPQD